MSAVVLESVWQLVSARIGVPSLLVLLTLYTAHPGTSAANASSRIRRRVRFLAAVGRCSPLGDASGVTALMWAAPFVAGRSGNPDSRSAARPCHRERATRL